MATRTINGMATRTINGNKGNQRQQGQANKDKYNNNIYDI